MKDIFNFQGKNYISAKRASDISDYSSDYIGQLCRAQKLDCRMIGHSWFVTEESLKTHKENVLKDEICRNRLDNLRGKKNQAKQAATEAVIVQLPTFIADSADTFPKASPEISQEILPEASKEKVDDEYASLARSVMLRRILNPVIVVCLVFGITVGTIFTSTHMSTDSGQGNNSASVYDAVKSIFAFIRDEYDTVLALFGHGSTLTLNTELVSPNTRQVPPLSPSSVSLDPPIASSAAPAIPIVTPDTAKTVTQTSDATTKKIPTNSDPGSGMAVVPSTGGVNMDDVLKKKIQGSFSDQVDVRPDVSGTAGVITPVFREAKGKDFIYVMVPVKPTQKTDPGTH